MEVAMAHSVEEVMSVSNSLSESEFADLEHFVATNQVNIMCMNKFDELGLMDSHGHPTEFAKTVVEETNG